MGYELIVNVEHIRKSIKQMSNGKAPGSNGLTAEVYKCGGYPAAYLILALYNEGLSAGFPDEMLEAKALLIPKGKASVEPTNYRPISLLNTEYKIIDGLIKMTIEDMCNE